MIMYSTFYMSKFPKIFNMATWDSLNNNTKPKGSSKSQPKSHNTFKYEAHLHETEHNLGIGALPLWEGWV